MATCISWVDGLSTDPRVGASQHEWIGLYNNTFVSNSSVKLLFIGLGDCDMK